MAKKPLNIDDLVKKLRVFGDVILLESQKADHPSSQRSYLAAKPKETIFSVGKSHYKTKGLTVSKIHGNPWTIIKDFQANSEDWVFGYFGYDLKNDVERLESKNPQFNSLPLYYFMKPEVLIEFELDGNYRFLKGEMPSLDQSVILDEFKDQELKISDESSISEEDYIRNVMKTKDLIHEGDVYEINYSYAKQFDFKGSGFHLYQKMRENGPVPFGAYLKLNDVEVCCASPERFLNREGNKVHSQPIKGTISNSEFSDIEDLKSEKNRAENLMIVDLVRNDLNRIAIPGSVKVDRLFEIQSFDTVHQLVSTVECDVEDEMNSLEIIKACFPMGSMTGAPKIAAMQAIDELENYSRGIYSGAIGYFKPNGDFDFNVVIRTAIIEDSTLTYPVGGAITSDSDPHDEWQETKVKTLALKKALK